MAKGGFGHGFCPKCGGSMLKEEQQKGACVGCLGIGKVKARDRQVTEKYLEIYNRRMK